MSARELVAALGGRWVGNHGLARCPAHNDRNPSLDVTVGKSGRLLFVCRAGCPQHVVTAALLERGLLGGGAASDWHPRADKAEQPPRRDNREFARKIWNETRPSAGTPVITWLAARGIALAPWRPVRFHPHLECRHEGTSYGHWPAMVVRLDDPAGNFSGIHRTWLTEHGRAKAPVPKPRMTLGPLGIAWLGHRNSRDVLAGEGLETVLSGTEIPGDWFLATPVFCVCAGELAKFESPRTVRRLFIAEDADIAGVRASATLRDRALSKGIVTTIIHVREAGHGARR